MVRDKSKDILGFVGIGYQDYLGARLLLINGLLKQGTGLAATAVEKFLKGVILIKGNKCKGHLGENLIRAVKNQQPQLYDSLNIDFIRFLKKAYKLRYTDEIKERFSIVINQYRTLAELDKTINLIDSGINITKNGISVDTVYRQGLEKRESLLVEENYIALSMARSEYLKKKNKVVELSIEPDTNGLSLSYVTDGVNDEGSFLKQVEISTKMKIAKITYG